MVEKTKQEDKWKEFLLKSSVPLEQLVSEKLSNRGFHIKGEYPYLRPNEQEIKTEFSIDIHASDKPEKETSDIGGVLHLLIECKYNHPGVRWIFSPSLREYKGPVSKNVLKCLDQLTSEFLENKREHLTIDPNLPFCTRGIELNTSGFDPNTIARGQNQLNYCLPNLVCEEIRSQIDQDFEDTTMSLICQILVTTANLYTLKTNLDLETYQSAKALEDVAQQTDALVLDQETGPYLYQYWEQVGRTFFHDYDLTFDEQSEMRRRNPILIENTKRLKERIQQQLPDRDHWKWFRKRVIPLKTRVIVVRLNALDNLLEKIKLAKTNARESIKKRQAMKVVENGKRIYGLPSNQT